MIKNGSELNSNLLVRWRFDSLSSGNHSRIVSQSGFENNALIDSRNFEKDTLGLTLRAWPMFLDSSKSSPIATTTNSQNQNTNNPNTNTNIESTNQNQNTNEIEQTKTMMQSTTTTTTTTTTKNMNSSPFFVTSTATSISNSNQIYIFITFLLFEILI